MARNTVSFTSPFDAPAAPFAPNPPPQNDVDITKETLGARLAMVRAHKKKLLANLARIEREAALLDEAVAAHDRFTHAVKYFNGLGDYASQRAGAALMVLDAEKDVEKAAKNLDNFIGSM